MNRLVLTSQFSNSTRFIRVLYKPPLFFSIQIKVNNIVSWTIPFKSRKYRRLAQTAQTGFEPQTYHCPIPPKNPKLPNFQGWHLVKTDGIASRWSTIPKRNKTNTFFLFLAFFLDSSFHWLVVTIRLLLATLVTALFDCGGNAVINFTSSQPNKRSNEQPICDGTTVVS